MRELRDILSDYEMDKSNPRLVRKSHIPRSPQSIEFEERMEEDLQRQRQEIGLLKTKLASLQEAVPFFLRIAICAVCSSSLQTASSRIDDVKVTAFL